MFDLTGLAIALAMVLTGLVLGHTVLYGLLHGAARLNRHLAVRLGHTLGAWMGWCAAVSLLPRSRDVALMQGASPAGIVLLVLLLVWLGLIWFWRRPPGTFAGKAV